MSGSVRPWVLLASRVLKLVTAGQRQRKRQGERCVRRRQERRKAGGVEVRVGTLKPAYKTERKKADICACRRLHGSEVDSSCSSMVQRARVGLILKEQYANSQDHFEGGNQS